MINLQQANFTKKSSSPTNLSKSTIVNDLKTGHAKMAVIGLGYVGLPLALEFANKLNLVGFDIKQDRVNMMKANEDPSGELERSAFENKNIEFTANISDLADAKFYIVAVPTPVDANRKPNLRALMGATESVARVLNQGVRRRFVYQFWKRQD